MSFLRREYECLVVLHRERSITSAARKLGMQQSGLSKLLMRLEDELGRKLFARGRSGLIPTAFGEKLVNEVTVAQDQWKSRYQSLLEREDRVEGEFRIGCHPVLASNYLSGPWACLQKDFPRLNLDLVLRPSIEVTASVADGSLHFGLVANPTYHPELVVRRIQREHVSLWSHGELSAGDVVYFNPDMLQIQSVLKKLKTYRLSAIRDYQLILNFLLRRPGQGAILPNPLLDAAPQGVVPRSKPYYWTEVCLIYRSDLPRTRAFREIVTRITESSGLGQRHGSGSPSPGRGSEP